MDPGIMQEGWLRWFAHPSVMVQWGMQQYPALAPNTQVFAPGSSEMVPGCYLGFLFCLFFIFRSRICPNCGMHTAIFSPILFLCIVLV